MKHPVLLTCTFILALAGCSGGGDSGTSGGDNSARSRGETVAATGTQKSAPLEQSVADSSRPAPKPDSGGSQVDWDDVLARVPADDREDALDLMGDAERKRAKAQEWIEDAKEKAAEAQRYRDEGDPARAARAEERAQSRRERATEKLAEAREDEQRVLALAGDRETAVSTSVDKAVAGFVPKADQFGVESFKIVYELDGQQTGRRTLYVEQHGDRVGIEEDLTTYNQPTRSLYLWDQERAYSKNLLNGEVFATRIRSKQSEPTSFAVTKAGDLQRVGYERVGDKVIAGQTCEHWVNEALNYDGCRWNHIEFEFHNGAGTANIIQSATAVEFVNGEGIPDHIDALSQNN